MDNKEYGRSIFIGFIIFVFVCAIAVFFTWCGHRKDTNDYQLHPTQTGMIYSISGDTRYA